MTFGSDEIGKPPEGAIRNFSQLLQMVEDGGLHTDLTRAMEKLIREINDHALIGRKASGKITVVIKMEADRGAVELSGSYSVKTPPEPRMRGSLLYIANNAYLSPRDPRQSAMVVRAVEGQRPEIRIAD